ncbi:Rha family transcriptional regulator [Aureimonas psammosilenae]|uniref:Rha family transcriptional regulator n=1 Tax=Aureimonas psammosilenae TaxID=2495496 RepID=UPI00126132FD|nr:Rha family transcriptional regulator [Aureimonas psammosilenae]
MIEPFDQNPNVIPVVRVKDGQTFANSRDVAAFFGKQHKDVLKKYDNLECSVEFAQRNFAPCEEPHPNIPGRMDRSIDMTRDGFVFIAFGFTGKRAAKFKEDYIAAFNAMEARLTRRMEIAASPAQGSLALTMETNDSLANIERQLHGIDVGLGSKMDGLTGSIIGAVIKHVARPILDLIARNQFWTEQRFEASYKRDKLLIETLAAKQDASECISIALAQSLMGVPAFERSARLSRNLSANAIHWFVARGFTARPDPSHANGPWVFQKSKIREWWEASGKGIYEREVHRKVVPQLKLVGGSGGAAS